VIVAVPPPTGVTVNVVAVVASRRRVPVDELVAATVTTAVFEDVAVNEPL
jgi:hypothetical protein